MKFIGLILCSVAWSSAYAVSKSLMGKFHPLEISFLRHFFALIPLLIACLWNGNQSRFAKFIRSTKTKTDLRILGVGLLTFFVSPFLQLKAISLTHATDAAVMIAIEPLITIVLAMLILRERMNVLQFFSIILAISGIFYLSEGTVEKFTKLNDNRVVGNLIFMSALICEGLYTIISKPALKVRDPIIFMTLAILIGDTSMFLFNVSTDGIDRLSGLAVLFGDFHFNEFIRFAFLGMILTAVGYLYWMWLLQFLPISKMALTLYIQPVFGILWGVLFLNEKVSARSSIGIGLILIAVLLGSILPERHRSS